MYYFPQAFLGVLAFMKKGKINRALQSLGYIFTSKEGIFSFNNPTPFINYLKSLVGRNIK
jgi:hypothetical protein